MGSLCAPPAPSSGGGGGTTVGDVSRTTSGLSTLGSLTPLPGRGTRPGCCALRGAGGVEAAVLPLVGVECLGVSRRDSTPDGTIFAGCLDSEKVPCFKSRLLGENGASRARTVALRERALNETEVEGSNALRRV